MTSAVFVAVTRSSAGDLLDPAVMRGVLQALRLKRDGTVAAAETQRRKRMTYVNAVRYAIELGQLRADPLADISWRSTETVQQVGPRVVVNPVQARNLLRAVSSVGKKWTDSGRNHDLRGLKSRPPRGTRTVPLPHELVSLRWESVDALGTADDGRLFFNEKGGIVGSTTYDRAWHEARELALSPGLVASPLAARPCDLRHSALSTWLNAGVDPTEVAERAGNSVEVLMTRCAKCLYGRQALANKRIDALLDECN
ncbi:site-specific integrase [Streptomyces sp. NBC_01343]|uniref:hypothetical protein n=1 Tax=Streptomyces sp. NBC_01343 TaxID=2903832 RepID=UPI002E119E99|nr:site-specific integrase [Streptomyces sp. NBC_01343]